jgi:hypothetical protein
LPESKALVAVDRPAAAGARRCDGRLCSPGVQKVFDFWAKNMLDAELIVLIKEYLKPVTNTLTVKLDTTLNNRQNGSGQAYGLTGTELLPYRQTAIDARK